MASFNYKTNQGERWDLVAFKMYGAVTGILSNDKDPITTLVEANPNVPIDPVFPDGTILVIPILKNTYSVIASSNLPPWKR